MAMRIRVCLYLRKSSKSKGKQVTSIAIQRKECKNFVSKRDGWEVVCEFVDEHSGIESAEERPGYRQMVAAAEREEFDVVVVLEQSRLSRSDPMEAMAELLPLRRAGVEVGLVDQNTVIDMHDFTWYLTGGIGANSASDETKKRARRGTVGQRELAARGYWVAGKTPLGYSLEKVPDAKQRCGYVKRIVLGDAEAVAAAKWMFTAYAEGNSQGVIREGLVKRGFSVTREAVRLLLKNPIYVGDYSWNRRSRGKLYEIRTDVEGDSQVVPKERKRRGRGMVSRPNSQKDWIYIRDNHPAIVDRATFNQIQASFERRQRQTTPHKKGGRFVLTGLCRCPECGRTLCGYVRSDMKGKPVTYRCTGTNSGTCRAPLLYQDDLLAGLSHSIRGWFQNPRMIAKVKQEAERQLKAKTKGVNVSSVKSQRAAAVAKLKRAESRLLEVSQDMVERIEAQIREIEERITEYDDVIESTEIKLDDALSQFDATADDVLAKLDQVDRFMNKSPEKVRAYLSGMIESIDVEVARTGKRGRAEVAGGKIRLRGSETCQALLGTLPGLEH